MKETLLEKVKQDLLILRLKDMAKALEATLLKAEKGQEGYLSFLAALVEKQLEGVKARSLNRRIQKANFHRNMTFETFDWNFQPGLNVEYLKDLSQLGFVVNREPLLLLGKTGTGKTHLATALGVRACEKGFRVEFFKLQQLLSKLYATLADDSTAEFIDKLSRMDLIIIDGVDNIRTKPEYPSLLLDLVSACQEQAALIATTRLSFEEWGAALGNPSITTAIVDRLFHRAHVINIRPGRSYRTQGPYAPNLGLDKAESS